MHDTRHPLLTIDLSARRLLVNAGAPLELLADSLSHDLDRVLAHPLAVPPRKARLTRIGGRCPVHGVLLEFDPWQPSDHRCARCNVVYHAPEHDDWWMMGAHLWTIERAVHAAALYLLRGDVRHAVFASNVLHQYANQYCEYPNRDNVLGPSRLFFSTYLESIWLLNVCHALALLEYAAVASPPTLQQYSANETRVWQVGDAQRIREHVLEPASRLISGYHEGRSNRQIWNEVAVCSAWRLLGHDRRVRERLDGEQGLSGLMAHGLDADGFWYEGENYHLFAHRGMWYGVELMRAMRQPLDPVLDARYRAGFVAPLLGILPDETFPSRRDSQYASSIRQWRTAEWCELGYAYGADTRLAGVLTTLYDSRYPRGETGRAYSTADSERNLPATGLTRADLSWRALLMAAPDIPHVDVEMVGSVCLPSQGLAIVRRPHGRLYVALDGGETGGGHGHPDQLALTVQTGVDRWLEDPGTGSYVEPRLFWYRSTLAHAAPFLDGASQQSAAATLEAFEDDGAFGWMVKRVEGVAPGVTLERTIVVCDSYVVDMLTWTSDEMHELSLPIAGLAALSAEQLTPDEHSESQRWQRVIDAPATTDGATADSLDNPMVFVMDREHQALVGPVSLRVWPSRAPLSAHDSSRTIVNGIDDDERPVAHVWYASSAPATLNRATVPATPGQGETQRHWLSVRAARGCIVGVWSFPSPSGDGHDVHDVQLTPDGPVVARIDLRPGGAERHVPRADGWRVECDGASGSSTVMLSRLDHAATIAADAQLAGRARAVAPSPSAMSSPTRHLVVPRAEHIEPDALPGSRIVGATTVVLGESDYVRTDESWNEAGAPTATVQLAVTETQLLVDVRALTGPIVVNASSDNPLDNEPGDVNADGVQWYVRGLDPARYRAPNHQPGSTPPDLRWQYAGLVVPRADAPTHTALTPDVLVPAATWHEIEGGWAIRLLWELSQLPLTPSGELAFELVVNERPSLRERRRGQLVLSGGGGFGYLAGARRAAGQFVRLTLATEAPKRRSADGPGLS